MLRMIVKVGLVYNVEVRPANEIGNGTDKLKIMLELFLI